MPKYYSIAAGESNVFVKSIYMVEIETLECQLPFVTEFVGGQPRCVLECHPECSDHGCLKPNDATACLTCRNSKYIQTFPGKAFNYDLTPTLSEEAHDFILVCVISSEHLTGNKFSTIT